MTARPRPTRGIGIGVATVAATALLLIGTRQTFIVPYTGLGQSPAQLLALVLTAVWVITRLRGGRGVPGLLPFRLALGASLLAATLAYVAGMVRGLNADEIASSDRALLTRAVALGFAVLVVEVVRTGRQLLVIVQVLVIGGFVSALAGLLQFATGVDVGSLLKFPGLRPLDTGVPEALLRAGYARAQGTASVPLEFGAVMTVLLPLAVSVAVIAARRGERAWPWWLASAVLLAAGAVSLSRSVFVGAAVAFVVLAWRWPLRRSLTVLAVLAVAVGVIAVVDGRLVGDIVDLLVRGAQDYSLQSRSSGRAYVAANVLHHLWLGQGLGTYQTGIQPVLDNQYLSELVESGLVGLTALVAVLVVSFGTARRARSLDPDDDHSELAAGLSAAVAAVAVVDLILDTAGLPQIFVLSWLVIGLCGASAQLALVSRSERRGHEPHRRIVDGPVPA